MRTTVTLDEDVFERLQGLSHKLRKPFRTVLNDAVRKGLGQSNRSPKQTPFRVVAHDGRLRPGFDERRFNQLADEMEAEAVASKLVQSK